MRLNNQISDMHPIIASAAQCLLKDVLDVTTQSLAVELCPSPSTPQDDSFVRFFDNFYVKPNDIGRVDSCVIGEKLSNIEADILNFFLSDDAHLKPYLFIDHAGRGKSTILKYLAFHLFKKEEKLQQHILPVYISLRAHQTTILEFTKASELHDFLCRQIKQKSFKPVYNFFLSNPCEPLRWLNQSYPSILQGFFSEERIKKIADNPAGFVEEQAQDDPSKMNELILGLLCYYSKHCRSVVLFLDDADNFTIDIQRHILDFAQQKLSYGLKVLVALRRSTWTALESTRRDHEPRISPPLNWSLQDFKNLLQRRLEKAREVVTLRTRNYKIDVSAKDIVNAFVDLLAHDQTADFLIRTSNFNLHSLMRKLALMPGSWHFNDKYLLKEILSTHTSQQEHGVRLWSAFKLVLGSYRGSFQSSDDMARSGIINCFCSRDDKHEPYTFFARLHILARLREHADEVTSLRIKDLRNEYMTVFGNNLSFSRVFSRTLYRLVQSGLIVTLSCRRYQSLSEVHEHIEEDKVFIADAGKYYMEWLINRIDYLLFMKDDIDWPDNLHLSHIEYVTVGAPKAKNHKNTLRSLRLLMQLELEMLSELQEQLTRPGDAQIAVNYVTLFSARRVVKGDNEFLFTRNMFSEYKKYLEWSFPAYKAELSQEIGEIENILSDYKEIRDAFRC